MYSELNAGKAIVLKDQVKYEKSKAIKQPFITADNTKLLLIAIDHGELPTHAAPADALITVLEGEGDLTYEGNTIHIHEHDSVKFEKGAMHSVKSDKKLKFSLLLLA